MPETAMIALIVGDEPLVRMIAAEMVEEAGFATIAAGDADQALTVLDALDRVDVLFTDIDMPGDLTGLQFASLVRKRRPAIRVIATSGRTRPTAADLPAPSTFIAKPYTQESLNGMLSAAH